MSKEKQIDEMDLAVLNCYRNKYYTDGNSTEQGIIANAINEVLPVLVSLKNAGYRKQEWISVDERLPEIYEDVLCYADGHSFYVDFICSDGKWCDDESRTNKITHWMPLPEAPKKGGAE